MTLNFCSFRLHILNAEITGVHSHIRSYAVLGTELRASRMLDNHSTNGAISLFLLSIDKKVDAFRDLPFCHVVIRRFSSGSMKE